MRRVGPLVLAGLVPVLGACSLLVSGGGDGPVRCEPVGGVDPCPDPLVCRGGECVPRGPECVPEEELCDGRDNDCNGDVDEGHDLDGDGFSWCGGGRPELRDCDDNEAGTHPDGGERCDGRDNDCNGTVDDGGDGLCPAGQQCLGNLGCIEPDCTITGCPGSQSCDLAATPPVCVEGRCTPGSCPADQICDTASGSCVRLGPFGAACQTDAQCESAVCAPVRATRLRADDTRFCTKACCTDADCAALGALCLVSGSGARLCVPPSLYTGEFGTGGPGNACESNAECASGACLSDGATSACMGNCGNSADCGGSGACALTVFDRTLPDLPDFALLSCRATGGSGDIGDRCTDADDCRSLLCLTSRGGGDGVCTEGCRTGRDCPDFVGAFGLLQRGACVELVRTSTPGREDFLRGCFPTSAPLMGRTGDACDLDQECLDLFCNGGRCADACCNDSDCREGARCRPVPRDGHYEMFCTPTPA